MKEYKKILEILSIKTLRQEILTSLMRPFITGYDELDYDTYFELLKSFNAPFKKIAIYEDGKINWNIALSTGDTLIRDARFCFVDIETTGGTNSGNLIDIGATILQEGEVAGEFSRLVYAEIVPEVIENLTGISTEMLSGAPDIKKVLREFREFLQDCIFVAHNVNFDYSYLYNAFIENNMPYMLNPYLCTLKLARKCIESEKYSLSFLNEFLDINTSNAHRALPDAITSREIFKKCLHNLPSNVATVKDLIDFSEDRAKS